MKVLIIYDSAYGNTEKIARSIGNSMTGDVKVLHVSDVRSSELESIDYLIIGSPTYGGRPTPAMQSFLDSISETVIKNVNLAVFDTRLMSKLVKIFGYAAIKIADNLKGKGANLIIPSEGFFVKSKEGPLKEGEEVRAASWAKEILKTLK